MYCSVWKKKKPTKSKIEEYILRNVHSKQIVQIRKTYSLHKIRVHRKHRLRDGNKCPGAFMRLEAFDCYPHPRYVNVMFYTPTSTNETDKPAESLSALSGISNVLLCGICRLLTICVRKLLRTYPEFYSACYIIICRTLTSVY